MFSKAFTGFISFQTITVEEWAEGHVGAEEQLVTVKQCHMLNNTCKKSLDFMLGYDGYSTQTLSSNIAAGALEASLNGLPSIKSGGSTSVSLESSNSTKRVYRVKFMFAAPETTMLLEDASPTRGFVTVELAKAGIRTAKGFRLTLEGVRSLPIHADDSKDDMNDVLKDMFTTHCTYSTRFGKCNNSPCFEHHQDKKEILDGF